MGLPAATRVLRAPAISSKLYYYIGDEGEIVGEVAAPPREEALWSEEGRTPALRGEDKSLTRRRGTATQRRLLPLREKG